MGYRSLPKFDANARFIANRAFLFNGQQILAGELVDGIPTRRLRQLFETRHVALAPGSVTRKEAAHTARKGKK
jgi:hypothetical protein